MWNVQGDQVGVNFYHIVIDWTVLPFRCLEDWDVRSCAFNSERIGNCAIRDIHFDKRACTYEMGVKIYTHMGMSGNLFHWGCEGFKSH
jgi:hypothetical protein